MRNLHGGDHDQRRQHIGHDVAQHNAHGAVAQAHGGIDVFLALFNQRSTAHGACVIGPLHGNQRDDDFIHALTEYRQQNQRNQNRRKRQLQIDHAHDRGVHPPAGIRRDQAYDDADGERCHGGKHTNAKTDAQAVKNRRQHVTALIIGAEQKGSAGDAFGTGRELAVHDVELRQIVRVLRRDQRRTNRNAKYQQ